MSHRLLWMAPSPIKFVKVSFRNWSCPVTKLQVKAKHLDEHDSTSCGTSKFNLYQWMWIMWLTCQKRDATQTARKETIGLWYMIHDTSNLFFRTLLLWYFDRRIFPLMISYINPINYNCHRRICISLMLTFSNLFLFTFKLGQGETTIWVERNL